ncbi:unnamed protein product [Scytosiphon promiscuus]
MVRAQHKFMPAGVTGAGGRALCHGVSPFVAERRGLFVAWENQMATFLGYSRDTVAVALNYFDRYTCAKTCDPTVAQAVAATALHIAAKFEETNPASLRQLLKYTPVFTPEQLLLMEMSLLKVLNWDLRPVTVYDFVRAFCNLLLPGGAGGDANAVASSGSFGGGAAVTLQCKEEKEKELDRLRVGAEDIADLASFDVCFVDFLPSTLATAALLLSVSRGTSTSEPATPPPSSPAPSSGLLRPTSHADVLDTCRRITSQDGTAAAVIGADGSSSSVGTGGGAAGSLHRVLECVQLLGSSLAERYPAVGAASASAAEGLARYAGLPVPSGVGERGRKEAAAVVTPPPGPSKVVTTTPVAVAKSRRCATPTGVEGIMHIEMDAIRSASAGGGGSDGAGGTGDVVVDEQKQQQREQRSSPSETGVLLGGKVGNGDGIDAGVGASGGEGAAPSVIIGNGSAAAAAAAASGAPTTDGGQQQRRRPTPIATVAAAGPNSTTVTERQRQHRSTRVRSESFTYTNEEIAFSRAAKQKSAQLHQAAAAMANVATAGGGGGRGGAMGVSEVAPDATAVMSNKSRKRSAEALGHCESGSGFGAPVSRFGGGGRAAGGSSKVARVLC